MRLLVQNPTFAPYRLAFFTELAGTRGLDVTFAYGDAPPGSALVSLHNPPGLKAQYLQNVYIGPGCAATWQRGLPRMATSGQFDAVVATYDPRFVTNTIACLKARRRGIPWIWWGHGIRPRDRYHAIYRAMASRANACILYTGGGAERLAACGVPREKLFVAWNSIDTAEITSLASSGGYTSRRRILYIGRLTAAKKPGLLVTGFAAARSQLAPGTILTIVGDGSELDGLRSIAAASGVADATEFVRGTYDQAALAPYFNDAWVSVSPGAVGLSAIHSLAYGVPMLVADEEPHGPEVEAVTDGRTGRFFAANDPDSLAAGLLAMDRDRSEAERLGAAGAQQVRERFSTRAMAGAFVAAIQHATGREV